MYKIQEGGVSNFQKNTVTLEWSLGKTLQFTLYVVKQTVSEWNGSLRKHPVIEYCVTVILSATHRHMNGNTVELMRINLIDNVHRFTSA